MIVYKYLPPCRLDVLEHSRIRFTQPAALNDPFETFPCFLDFGPRLFNEMRDLETKEFGVQASQQSLHKLEIMVTKKLLELPHILSRHFVILSLSRIRDNAIMWSHYADSHRGFLIGFDANSDFFSPGAGKARDGLMSVRYSNKRYKVPKGGFRSLDDPGAREANAGLFFTKGINWSYEREMRILAHPNSADAVLPDPSGYEIRLFNFPVDCVKEVIFGFKISEPDQHRAFDLVRSKYPLATIGKAFPHQSKFAVIVKTFAG